MARQNLVWLIFDSVRADRGGENDGIPAMSRLGSGSRGTAGTCTAHAIWSQPSIASMLTGVFPSTHRSGCGNETLPAELPTVAERFSSAGYRTIGISSNPYFSPSTNADRGFDVFDEITGLNLFRKAGSMAVTSFLRRLRRVSGGLTTDRRKHSPDYLLSRLTQRRIDEASDEPFFLMAHFPGAHHPYYPPPAIRSRFADDLSISGKDAAQKAFDLTSTVYETIAHQKISSEPNNSIVKAMYDAQLAHVDKTISRFLARFDEHDIADDTILVVTSDHGDLLGEYGLCSHKLVTHDALARVPIAVRGSESLVDADLDTAQHIDVLETILAEMGVDTSGMQGVRLDRTTREAAIVQRGEQTYRKTMSKVRELNPEFSCHHALDGFVSALRTDRWKYVSGATESRLYELDDESTDVADTHPDVATRLSNQLTARTDDHADPVATTANAAFDDVARRRLTEMGYLPESQDQKK